MGFQQNLKLADELFLARNSRGLVPDSFMRESPSHPHATVKLVPVSRCEFLKENRGLVQYLLHDGICLTIKTWREGS